MPKQLGPRTFALAALAAILVVAPASAQKKEKDKDKDKVPDTITLSGCVVRSETSPTQYTIEDKERGTIFRLTGVKVSDYIGKPVVIIGTGSKKLAIVGGLGPDPNVAAQAGAMDPARAAVATQTAAASPRNPELPEFKVKSVRPAKGSCPE